MLYNIFFFGNWLSKPNSSSLFFVSLNLYNFWKVTSLVVLQNIGCIPYIVQYILEPILWPVVCTSHSLASILPPTAANHVFVLYICKSASFVIPRVTVFFRFHIYMISSQYLRLSVWLISFLIYVSPRPLLVKWQNFVPF